MTTTPNQPGKTPSSVFRAATPPIKKIPDENAPPQDDATDESSLPSQPSGKYYAPLLQQPDVPPNSADAAKDTLGIGAAFGSFFTALDDTFNALAKISAAYEEPPNESSFDDKVPHARHYASMRTGPVVAGDWHATLDACRSEGTDLDHLDKVKFGPALGALHDRLVAAGFKDKDMMLISLYRTPEHQKQIINEHTVYDANGNAHLNSVVASEYGSCHVIGCAADLKFVGDPSKANAFYVVLGEIAPELGLKTIKNDPGHVQLDDPEYIAQLRQEKFGAQFQNLVYQKPKSHAAAPLNTI